MENKATLGRITKNPKEAAKAKIKKEFQAFLK